MNIRTHLITRAVTHFLCCSALLYGSATAPLFFAISNNAFAQDSHSNALLKQAVAYEQATDYVSAAEAYRQYLQLPEPQSAARRHARLKLPVLQEAAKYGAGPEIQVYLNALDERAAGDSLQADQLLIELIESYAGSALVDDALYLRAYIALMDNYDYPAAIQLLEHFRANYPHSRYIDTVLFAEAIAHEQMGDGDTAVARMTELRDRHTGLSMAGVSWAKDQYMSRLWFERSSRRIDYLEERTEIATHLLSMTPYGRDGYYWQAELLVNRQHMTLLLNKSETVTNAVFKGNAISPADNTLNAFAGIVAGQPDSWARITIDNKNVRGMISTNNERHELLPVITGGSLSEFHTLLLGDIDGNASEAPDHVLIPPKSEDKLDNFLRTIKTDTQVTEGVVNQVAKIGVVVDSKYNDYYSGRGAAEALSILNATDGIFREQLGTAVMVDTIIVIEDRDNDPMNLGSVPMEAMMRNFREYRMQSADLDGDIGLATLFSGNKNSDSALGLAWIGSACRTDGFDVSVVTPYNFAALLSTHEIGHTMGAPHDSDTNCAAESNHIMWPFLSRRSGRTFSSCSKESVAKVMAANYCYVDALDLSVTLQDVSSTSLSINIRNEDPQRATPDGVLTISAPHIGSSNISGNCNAISNDRVQCRIGTITPLDSTEIEVDFQEPLDESAKIAVVVAGDSFIDVNTKNNSFQTDLHGNTRAFSTIDNSDQITLSDNFGSSSTNQSQSSAGGTVNPLSAIILTMLLVIRRMTDNKTGKHIHY